MAYQDIFEEEMRRRKVNEALMQQAFQSNRTEQAGGRVVPYGLGEGMTQLGQAMIARSAMDASEGRLAAARKEREAKQQEIITTAMGSPEVPAVTEPLLGPNEFQGGAQEMSPGIPAVEADPQRAMLMAVGDQDTTPMAKVIAAMQRKEKSPYAKIDTEKFTQPSLRKFDKTGNRNDLVSVQQLKGHASDRKMLATSELSTFNAKNKIKEILKEENKDAFNRNFGGYNAATLTQFYPDAQDMKEKISSLKSELKTAGLEVIRASGSPGTITEKEWPIFEKMVDSISPLLSEGKAREILGNIDEYMDNKLSNSRDHYKTQWGGTDFYDPVTSASKSKEETASKEDRYQAYKKRMLGQ